MASPNHKAGLAVVVPASDHRSQPRGKVKQNAFNSPRKILTQSNKTIPTRSPNGTPSVPTHCTGFASQPNRTSPMKEPIAISPLRVQISNVADRPHANGMTLQQPNGLVSHELKKVVPARRRLLEVDEALQYSPFSSIVPFSSGTSYSICWPWY